MNSIFRRISQRKPKPFRRWKDCLRRVFSVEKLLRKKPPYKKREIRLKRNYSWKFFGMFFFAVLSRVAFEFFCSYSEILLSKNTGTLIWKVIISFYFFIPTKVSEIEKIWSLPSLVLPSSTDKKWFTVWLLESCSETLSQIILLIEIIYVIRQLESPILYFSILKLNSWALCFKSASRWHPPLTSPVYWKVDTNFFNHLSSFQSPLFTNFLRAYFFKSSKNNSVRSQNFKSRSPFHTKILTISNPNKINPEANLWTPFQAQTPNESKSPAKKSSEPDF